MAFIDYDSYLLESDNPDNSTISKTGKIETEYGWLDYYYEISDEYPDGVIVDLGGFIYKEYRDQGKMKEMLKEMLSSVPEGTIVQLAVKSKKLLPMFKRLGFKFVKSIAYWGEVTHAMENIVSQELIDKF